MVVYRPFFSLIFLFFPFFLFSSFFPLAPFQYFFSRNGSALVAFKIGEEFVPGNGFVVLAAHSDSPCLKLKPVSKFSGPRGYNQLDVTCYGGGIWRSWFDRDLTVGGRVFVRDPESSSVSQHLVLVDKPFLRIPSLAIHLSKGDERSTFSPNNHLHLHPIFCSPTPTRMADESGSSPHHSALLDLVAAEIGCEREQILDMELQLCDTMPSDVSGEALEGEGGMVCSGRLDNLCSVFQCTEALIEATSGEGSSEADKGGVKMVCVFDHEEVGSGSFVGAESPILSDVMNRVVNYFARHSEGKREEGEEEGFLERSYRKSLIVSVDMAHALHPNYADRHDTLASSSGETLAPLMGSGIVIKYNANQRYATNGHTSLLFTECLSRAEGEIPFQRFAVRDDMRCGSTIGPISAAGLGIRTIDIGSPQLSMHSIREVMSSDDLLHGFNAVKAVFDHYFDVDESITL